MGLARDPAEIIVIVVDTEMSFIGLAQYPDLLLSRVSLAFHGLGPFWIPRLTLSMVQFS